MQTRMVKALILLTLSSLFVSTAFAQIPPVGIKDEGGAETKPVFTIDCVGAGISCSHSGVTGTLTVAGGGSSTFTGEHDNTQISSSVSVLDILTGLNASMDGQEMNVHVDEGDITVTNLASACTDAQVLGGNAAGTGVECQADAGGGLATTDIDYSSELLAIIVDETGSGQIVFNNAPTLTGITVDAITLTQGGMADDAIQADDIDLADFTCADLTTSDCGAITTTGNLTLQNTEFIDNAVNSVVCINGAGGAANNEDFCIDTETYAYPMVFSNTSTGIVFNDLIYMLDDIAMWFGAAGDVRLQWETEGNDNLQLGTNVGNANFSGYISIMEDVDMGNANRSPSGTSANPVLRVYSSDAGNAADYIEMYHDQTSARIDAGTGNLILRNISGSAAFVFDIGVGKLAIQDSNTTMINIKTDSATAQSLISTEDAGGNQVIISNDANSANDHDHATQTNPTLFIHSDKDPDTDNTEWISLSHDQTDAQIAVGSGDIYIDGFRVPEYYQYTFLPSTCILDDNSPPALSIIESTGTGTPRFRVAAFDAATDEIIYCGFTVPDDYNSSGTAYLDVYWHANDTGANEDAIWAAQISCTTEADADDMEEQAVDTYNSESEDVDTNEADRQIVTPITLTNMDSAAASDECIIRFFRDADDSLGDADADALTSDAEVTKLRLRLPRK